MCSPTTAWWHCRAECKIPIGKEKSKWGIGHTQKTPLKGMHFESLEEAQAYLDRWEERWADTRIHARRVQEGKTKQVTLSTRERNKSLRVLALGQRGVVCEICDFDFAKKYGNSQEIALRYTVSKH